MTVTNSPKKRKRTSSAGQGRKFSIQLSKPMPVDMDLDNDVTSRDVFESKLGDAGALQEYDDSYNELLEAEENDAWDREARPKGNSRSLSNAIERRAATIVHAIREYERKFTFGNLPSEAIPAAHTLDMGGQFLTNKGRIDTQSELFRIARQVPKGALLHLHFNAELDPDRLLQEAQKMENMYIRSIMPLNKPEAFAQTEMVFSVLDSEAIDSGVDIFSPEYPAEADNWKDPKIHKKIWMKWSDFRAKYNEMFPKGATQSETPADTSRPVRICSDEPKTIELDAAETWLKSKMILSPEEAYGQTQTVNG